MYFCCIKQIEKIEKKYSSQPFLPPIYYYFWQDNNFSSKTIMKRNLTFLAFTLLFLPAALLAQQKTVYSRMNGKIGDSIDVAGNFQRSGSQMEGNYSFKLEVNDSLTHLSHIVTLYGDIDRHNEVIFKQYHTDDTAIDGLFYDQRFVGSWYDHKGSTVQPFTLTESYPKGSMPMNIFYLHSDKELVPRAQGSPSAEIELTLLYPKSSTHISQAVVDSVKKTGKIVRPFLGVRYVAVTPTIQKQNSLPVDYGVLVLRGDTQTELAVVPGSPADKADLEEGDIILEVDGVKLDENTSLASRIRKKAVGDTIELKILHKGTEKTVTVALEEMPQ